MIGSHTARLLVDSGKRPIILEISPQHEAINNIVNLKQVELSLRSILNYEDVYQLVKTKEINKIVHTVANPLLNAGAQEKPLDATTLNVIGTANILEVARKLDLDRVVFLSSATLYTNLKGGSEFGKLSEDHLPRTTNIYTTTKLACENLGLNYVELYGIDFVALRPVGVFGPWSGQGGGGRSNMMRRIIENISQGKEAFISPWVGELVYVKDVANAIQLALRGKKLKRRVYNIGMGKIYSPQEIISIFAQLVAGAEVKIDSSSETMLKFKPTWEAERPIDLTRSKSELSYEPSYDMPKAIGDYIDWNKKGTR